MLIDRDVVTRAVIAGLDPKTTPARKAMRDTILSTATTRELREGSGQIARDAGPADTGGQSRQATRGNRVAWRPFPNGSDKAAGQALMKNLQPAP
jgi:hypothetical protein